MMKKVVVLTALLMSCFAVGAMAAEGPYFSGNLGVTMPTDSDVSESGLSGEITYDAGFAIGAALGYEFGAGRLEAELGYKIADTDKVKVDGLGSASIDGDLSVLSFMANGYLDFNASPTVKPYLMAGIGVANVKLDSSDLDADDNDTVFAYQAGVGVGFAINDKVTIDISYRYMGTQDPTIDGTDIEYGSHNILAGVRVKF